MSPSSPFRRLFRLALRRPRAAAREVDEEIRFHLEMRAEQLMERGYPPDGAREEAARRFGDLEVARTHLERTAKRREARMLRRERLEALWHDITYGARQLARAPGFTATVVLTLALAIGANATMFGIIDRLLLKPPAFLRDPGATHRVYLRRWTPDGTERTDNNISYTRYAELRESTTAFSEAATFFNAQRVLGTGEEARELETGLVSASFWPFFGVRPALGRFFLPEEDRAPEGTAVAVLGYGFWQSSYGGSERVLGEQIRIGGKLYTIIGVAPRGFNGMSTSALAAYVPITAAGFDMFGSMYAEGHNISWTEMMVRRRPGVSVEAAAADLTNAYRRSLASAPNARPLEESRPAAVLASVIYDRGPKQGQNAKVATWLVGVSAIVLLIACANVANLLLARARRRGREIAVRVALGVSRGRLVSQLLTESLLLAALGGAAGLMLAHWGGGVLRALLLPNVDWTTGALDVRMLLFTLGAAVVAGVLAGLAPAAQASGADVSAALKTGGREGSLHRSRTRTALLLAQIAMSVVLLVGAGLFTRSLHNVNTLHLGYDAERIVYLGIEMRGAKLDAPARLALTRRVLERARALPEVENATVTRGVPFWMTWVEDLFIPGRDSVNALGEFVINPVSPEYFATTGTRLLRGRAIADADREGTPLVAVVSESMARLLWPREQAIGQCLKVGADTAPCSVVVGIAEDIRRSFDDAPLLQYYLAAAQREPARHSADTYFIRTRGEAHRHLETVRRAIQRELPGAAFASARPFRDIIAPEIRPWKLGATMFSVFGALALLVAAVGLYGVIAFNVTQRMHELGVRVALGARGTDIVRLVLGEGVRVALAGIAVGTGIAILAARYVAPLLYHVAPRDPPVLVAVGVTLLAVAVAASVLPAARAARADPNIALRSD